MNLSHRAYGGSGVVAGGLLLDADGGRQAFDHVHIGLVHQLQKLASVSAQALHIAALAFGVQCVKRQAGLARTAKPRNHHQLVARDIDIDVFQVVRARTPDADVLLLQSTGQVSTVGGCCQDNGQLRETHHDSKDAGQLLSAAHWGVNIPLCELILCPLTPR